MPKGRVFSAEFKAQVVLEVLSGAKSASAICREHRLKPEVLNRWKAEFVANAAQVFGQDEQHSAEQARIAELERLVGRQALELEAAKKASQLLRRLQSKSERS